MFIAILSILFACQSKEDDSGNPEDTGPEGIDCTADFRTSANITIFDQQGAPLPGVEVSYTVNGVEGTYIDTWEDGTTMGGEAGDFVVSMYIEVHEEILVVRMLEREHWIHH